MNANKFKIEVSDWTKINLDNAKFILEEAKTYVKYVADASDKITNRAFAILAILIPITSALIVFFVNEKVNPTFNDKVIVYLLFFVSICLIVIMFGLGKIVFPRMFMPLGREPKQICTEEMMAVNFEVELSKLAIVLNEIENCQYKIEYNERQNCNRTKLLENLMLSIGLLFALSIVVIFYHII